MKVNGAPTELQAAWEPPTEPNGIILFYTIYCYESQGGSGTGSGLASDEFEEAGTFLMPMYIDNPIVLSLVLPPDQNQAFVIGLKPFTVYECYITANTSVGEGDPSGVQLAMTDEASKNINLILSNILKVSRMSMCTCSPLHCITLCNSYCCTTLVDRIQNCIMHCKK